MDRFSAIEPRPRKVLATLHGGAWDQPAIHVAVDFSPAYG
jgi:hypothetical protein